MAAISWTGAAGDGNFNNPSNWSPPQVPGASDTVTISPSAASLINISQNDAVQSLATSHFVTLSINDNSALSVGNTNTANAALANAGTITINAANYRTGLLIASPEVTLSGGGTIAMGNNGGNYIEGAQASAILNNTGNTITGGGQLGDGQLTFINGSAGVVDATLATQLVLNTGTIAVSNAGLLEATAGNGLVIESNVTNASGGNILANGGNVILGDGADISGGTLSSVGTSAIDIGNAASLDGSAATVTNLGTVAVQDNTTLTLLGNIANQGAITVTGVNYQTEVIVGPGGATAGTVTLSGSGTMALDGSTGDLVTGGIAGDTLINKETITGGGRLGGGTLTLINQGTISATGSNSLFLNTGTTVTNDALLEAQGTGGLVIQSTVNDSAGGTILAAGAAVTLNGGTVQGGLIETTGAGVFAIGGGVNTLDGSAQTVTNTGLVSLEDSAVLTLLGTITNQGTIALNNVNYDTDLLIGAPTVTLTGGGHIVLDNGASNRIYGAAGSDVLDNLNNIISGAGQLGLGQMVFINGTAGTVDANAGDQLVLSTTGTIMNSGLLEAVAGSGGLAIESSVNNGTSGRIAAAGGTVLLGNGADIVGGTLSSSGTGSVLISNSATLGAGSGTLTNTGTVLVQDGTTLTLLGTISNSGKIVLSGNNYYTDLIIGPGGTQPGTVTLTGSGTLSLDDNGGNRIYAGLAGDTLVNMQTISGAGQIGAGTGLVLVNHGTVDAVGANSLILQAGVSVTNDALMQALGSGGLLVEDTVNGSGGGTLLAATGDVFLNGATIQGGLLESQTGEAVIVSTSALLDGSAQTVTNAGLVSLNDGTTLTLLGTITNTGTIALNNANYDTDLIAGGKTVTLTGGGTILLGNGGGNRIYGSAARDVLVNVNNLIEGAGQIGADQMTLVNKAAGVIDANGSAGMVLTSGGGGVTNSGLIEATSGAGLTISTTVNDSSGGTILAAGANVVLYNGTIAGGLVETSGTGSIVVAAGTLDGSAHTLTNKGLVTIVDGSTLSLLGTITNDGTIAANAANYATDIVVASATLTLNGGGTIALGDSGGNRIYGASGTDVLDNVNNLIEGAGQIGAAQLTLINGSAGVIDANLGAGLTLSTGGVTAINAGLIEATSGGVLIIDSAVDSSSGGTILANAANIYLDGGTLAGGVVNTLGGGAVIVNQGGTLDGSAHTLTNEGLVYVNDGETLTLLGNIANQGTISLNNVNYNTDMIIGSAGVTLSGAGTILLGSGNGNRIYGSTAAAILDNASNTIKGAGQIGAGELTLINNGLIEATGSNALVINLGSTGTNTASGEMLAVGAGGLVFQNGTYTNLGLIQADNGSSVSFRSDAVLTNDASGTLTGGAYAAIDTGNDATLSITGSAVTTLAAEITLSGTGSAIEFGGTALEQSLSSISAGGTLNILNDRNFDATANSGNFTDNGVLTLGGGTFTSTSLMVGSHAFLNGFGVIDGGVVNNGTITVEGGTLIFDGPLTGNGTLTTGTGGIIDLMGGGTLNQGVTGTGTLELQGGSFTLTGTQVTIANLDIDAGTSLSGNGTITSATVDKGSLQATSGTLTLDGALSGTGILAAASGAVLIEAGGGNFGGTIMGAGTVFIDRTTTFTSGIELDVGTLVDSANVLLSANTNITNQAGDVFMLTRANNPDARHREQIQIKGNNTDSFTNAGSMMANADALIDVKFINTGAVAVQAGTLTLARALSGTGGFAVSKKAIVDLTGGASFAGAFTGAGMVRFDAAATLESGATLGVTNVIDTALITLGSGESLTNAKNHNFTMTNTGALDGPHREQVEVKGGQGSTFTNAGTVTADAATQSFALNVVNSGLVSASAGTLAFLGALKNTGVMNATGAEISASRNVSGSGTLEIGTGGTMALLDGAAAGQVADFLSGAGSLDLGNPLNFNGMIEGFSGTAMIDLLNTAETGFNFAGGVLTVTDGNNTVASLHLAGSYTNSDFAFASDGNGGTVITFK